MDCCQKTLELGRVSGHSVYHSCLVQNCEVYCSGSNMYGQLGDQTGQSSEELVKVIGIQGRALSVEVSANSGGVGRSCAQQENKDVVCWGYMGDGDFFTEPTRVVENAKDYSNGKTDVCFVTKENKAECLGDTNIDHLTELLVDNVWLLDGILYGSNGSQLISKYDTINFENPIVEIDTSEDGICVLLENGDLSCLHGTTPVNIAQNIQDFSCGAHGCVYVDNEKIAWRMNGDRIAEHVAAIEVSTYRTCIVSGLTIQCLGVETNTFSYDGQTFSTICSATAESCSPNYIVFTLLGSMVFATILFCCCALKKKQRQRQVAFEAVPVEEEIDYDIEKKQEKIDAEARVIVSKDGINLMDMRPEEIGVDVHTA